ncbi:glutamate racemase [bacterium]|nr:glutamate racemase [bacterium]
MKIGVFDSGVGGMTVLSELRRRFGSTHFVYLGDTAHVPYGAKSPAQVRKFSAECSRTLRDRGISALVVACNTASSLALDQIRDVCGRGIQVLGVVEPGVSAALEALKQKPLGAPVLVLATKATVKSGLYGRLLREKGAMVFEQACPLLVPMIEEGWTDHPVLHQVIEEYVRSYRSSHLTGVALLGCTHYPWIQEAFQKALPGWTVVNSAQAIASALCKIVDSGNQPSGSQPEGPQVDWIFTDPEAVPEFVLPLA